MTCPECGSTSPTTEEVEALYAEVDRLRRELADARQVAAVLDEYAFPDAHL